MKEKKPLNIRSYKDGVKEKEYFSKRIKKILITNVLYID